MKELIVLVIFSILLACQGNPYTQGGYLYELKCSSCHMQDGSGLGANIPTLVDVSLFEKPDYIVCVIYQGIESSDSGITSLTMPPNKSLTPTEIANIINYMQFEWEVEAKPVSESWVEKTIQDCKSDLRNDRDR